MNQDVQNFIAILDELQIYSRNLIDNFATLIESRGAPADYYEPIAYGAYKECYRLTDKYVIKFCANDNETQKELDTLRQARSEGLQSIFNRTFHLPITTCELDVYYLDHINECGEDIYFTDILIQPFVDITMYSFTKERISYSNESILDEYGQIMPRHPIKRALYNVDDLWLQSAVLYYGSECIYKLADFILCNNIYDIHNANIGWIKKSRTTWKPIIFDWLS